MTEQEGLQAANPQPMLEFLKGKASDRKLDEIISRVARLLGGLFGVIAR